MFLRLYEYLELPIKEAKNNNESKLLPYRRRTKEAQNTYEQWARKLYKYGVSY